MGIPNSFINLDVNNELFYISIIGIIDILVNSKL